MIRPELISNLADKHPQLTASDVELAVKSIVDSIANQLGEGCLLVCFLRGKN